jgi:hypothetical protein
VLADDASSYSVDRLDAFVEALVDKARATVAAKVFFALRPPLVLRKWAGDGGDWFVEVRMSRRVASAFDSFSIGNPGSLRRPDWQSLGEAALVGGTAASCTFRLAPGTDAAAVVADVTEIRPVLQ